MDAMDQDKTAIPRLCETPKSLGNIWRLKVNLMGAIVHGIGVYGFFDAFQWAHGASYTLSVLVHILSMLDFLPDVLYLQLDNCPGQNKNRYVLGFVAKLVEANIFKKVKVSFLMVGHTHEDIDQLFSRFSVRASREDIFILDDLITTFEKCYKQLPVTGMKIAEVYDFQEWLQLNNIKNHSHPHVFKFTKNEDGKATMKYKKWSTDKKWITSTGSDKYLLQDMDDGPIKKIKPNVDNLDFERLRHDTDQVARFYNKEKIASWWDSFLSELEEEDDDELPPLSLIQNLREKKCDAIVQEEPVEHLTPEDEPIPQVVIGKKTHIIDEEIKEGDLVLTDTPLSPEDWPQVARVVEILPENRLKLQPYWGKKTTTWTPAYRKNKGPIYITVNKNVIWHHGFNLTQSGYLPKNIKELVGKYEEDNL